VTCAASAAITLALNELLHVPVLPVLTHRDATAGELSAIQGLNGGDGLVRGLKLHDAPPLGTA
jgi:hypothetical protein